MFHHPDHDDDGDDDDDDEERREDEDDECKDDANDDHFEIIRSEGHGFNVESCHDDLLVRKHWFGLLRSLTWDDHD